MTVEENWAVAAERVRDYFVQEMNAKLVSDGLLCDGCRISLSPCEGKVGIWKIPRTQIRIEGPDEDVKALYHRFYIRFISAGG